MTIRPNAIAREDITLGLLAGGRATRLGGRDKAWLERDGIAQVVRLARRFGPETGAVLVSANRELPRYAQAGIAAVPDRIADAGPLGGLDALAAACRTPWLLTLPVDLVDANDCLLRSLVSAAAANGARAQDASGLQPLVALWRVDALRDAVAAALREGRLAVQALQLRLDMAVVHFAGVRFGNLNTPDDLRAAGIDMHRDMANQEFPSHISYAEARAIIARVAGLRRMPIERVAIARAHGRVLAGQVIAPMAMPGFDNSAMDGFALRHADLAAEGETVLALCGEQFAGPATVSGIGPGDCARITTGAPLPPGADTVVMKERTVVEGDRVRILEPVAPGRNVRRRGEDVVAGDLLASAGEMLGPARVALLAAQGIDTIEVARRPTVAVFSTGDELVEPGMPLAHGQVYNSNRELLMGLLRAEGLEPVAWPTLPDDPAAIESALRHAGEAFDVVLTCGGVSAGEKDLLPALLQRRGHVHFWKVRMRPGMPALFADGGTLGPALFLCLPGNPVSVLATCLALARPLLDGLQGRAPRKSWRARLSSPWRKRHARLEFLRARLDSAGDGTLTVEPDPADGSHRMRAAADADALIVLEEGEREYAVGDVVEVVPY